MLALSSHKGARLHRSVAVLKGGTWVDTGGRVVSAGLALPDNGNIEYLRNADYRLRAQKAAAAGLGMWGDPQHCGAGPSQDAPIAVQVLWDAPGNDNANINGEYAEVTNGGQVPLPLGGWWLRDNAYRGTKAHGFAFPAAFVLAPGATVRVHPGVGSSTSEDLYWGLAESVFENVTGAPTSMATAPGCSTRTAICARGRCTRVSGPARRRRSRPNRPASTNPAWGGRA